MTKQINKLTKQIIRRIKNLLFSDTIFASHLSKKAIYNLIAKKNPIILEIGCADGLDTLDFLKNCKNKDLKIYCFEPDPRNIKTFKEQVSDPRVQLLEMAIGDVDGKMTFNQSSTIYSSSLKTPNIKNINSEWPEIRFEKSIEVDVITIDTFVKKYNIDVIDFIWVDVQGAEDLMLYGAKQSLVSKIKYIYTEYNTVEYYNNILTINDMKQILGPEWKILKDYKTDVLFKNNKIK